MITKILIWLGLRNPEPEPKKDDLTVEYKIEDFRTQLQKDYDNCQQIKKKHKIQ